jgi:hypothetical protein
LVVWKGRAAGDSGTARPHPNDLQIGSFGGVRAGKEPKKKRERDYLAMQLRDTYVLPMCPHIQNIGRPDRQSAFQWYTFRDADERIRSHRNDELANHSVCESESLPRSPNLVLNATNSRLRGERRLTHLRGYTSHHSETLTTVRRNGPHL